MSSFGVASQFAIYSVDHTGRHIPIPGACRQGDELSARPQRLSGSATDLVH